MLYQFYFPHLKQFIYLLHTRNHFLYTHFIHLFIFFVSWYLYRWYTWSLIAGLKPVFIFFPGAPCTIHCTLLHCSNIHAPTQVGLSILRYLSFLIVSFPLLGSIQTYFAAVQQLAYQPHVQSTNLLFLIVMTTVIALETKKRMRGRKKDK